jgi:hypothetical protein
VADVATAAVSNSRALPSARATWAPAAAALAATVYENNWRVIMSMRRERGCRCEVMAGRRFRFGDNQTFCAPRFKPIAAATPSDFSRSRFDFNCSGSALPTTTGHDHGRVKAAVRESALNRVGGIESNCH